MDREIVVLGDVHGQEQRLERVLDLVRGIRPELAVLVGDVGIDPPWGVARTIEREEHDASVDRVLAAVRDALGVQVAYVPGNHDLPDPVDHAAGVNLDRRFADVGGFTIVGIGGAGPTLFGFPYEWTEKQADIALRGVFDGRHEPVDVLVSHTPPRATTLDRTHRGAHVGSRAVRRWIAKARPRLFLCGHIHESWGATTLDGVPAVNAGAMGEPYPEEIAWRIAWGQGGPVSIRSVRRTPEGSIEERDW